MTLRISIDAKATIKLGNLSRGGRSRIEVRALDHDFVSKSEKLHLLGFYLPDYGENFFFFLSSPSLTADAILDCLQELWDMLKTRFSSTTTLLLNLDNGPECNSRRTQFMSRLVGFVDENILEVKLAYYPPYHSKYNPIERVWGVLEQHWNGSILDSLETVVKMAGSMTYKKRHPIINVIDKIYKTGVSLCKKAMIPIEERLQRHSTLPKYFLTIPSRSE